MSSVNKVTILGRLGADPEVRSLNNGDKVVNLRIATSESWRDKNSGERKEKTEWHSVVIFNEGLAKIAEQYLRKGSQVYIEGKLQTRSWEDQSGQKKYTTEIVLQRYQGELTMIGSKPEGDSQSGQSDRSQDYSSAKDGGKQSFSNDMDDEIPF